MLFNAHGDYKNQIEACLNSLPAGSHEEILFENKITSLYHIFNIFIHTPINSHCEAFGQTYIESMASKTPLIATKSGIANEILVDGINALVVPYKDSEAIYEAMVKILEDNVFTVSIVKNAEVIAEKYFSLNKMITDLENLYLK